MSTPGTTSWECRGGNVEPHRPRGVGRCPRRPGVRQWDSAGLIDQSEDADRRHADKDLHEPWISEQCQLLKVHRSPSFVYGRLLWLDAEHG